jgi:hypothetical protein
MREIYKFVGGNSRSRAQTAWCWAQWKMYRASEILRLPKLKRIVQLASKLVGKLSDDYI